MKLFEVLLIVFVTVLTLVITFGVCIGNYLYKLVINAYTDKSAFLGGNSKKGSKSDSRKPSKNFSKSARWLLEKSVCEFMYSFDNLRLNYYLLRNEKPSDNWVIMCHGYNGNALRLSEQAINFHNMGYNLIIPDARGHGKSEGDYIGMGWHDRLDVIAYIKRVIAENENAKIILYGCSMGASTILMASGEKLPHNVKIIIADCGYSSAWDELTHQLKRYLFLPSFPLLNFMSFMTKINAGYKLKDADAVKQVKKSNIPTLFIHGSDDTFVPTKMIYKLFDAANSPKEKLIVENAAHVESFKVNPELYWNKIGNFLDQYFKD